MGGSYFNNFDNTTHVSEILGANSAGHSLDVVNPPNTKTFGSVTTSHTQGSTTSKNAFEWCVRFNIREPKDYR